MVYLSHIRINADVGNRKMKYFVFIFFDRICSDRIKLIKVQLGKCKLIHFFKAVVFFSLDKLLIKRIAYSERNKVNFHLKTILIIFAKLGVACGNMFKVIKFGFIIACKFRCQITADILFRFFKLNIFLPAFKHFFGSFYAVFIVFQRSCVL